MENLESFKNFESNQVSNMDLTQGGTLYPTWRSVEDKITDFYDTDKHAWVYLEC